jgi:hypothetical protein
VSEEFVTKQVNKLNVKKATGHDGISPKILKMAQQEITNPIGTLKDLRNAGWDTDWSIISFFESVISFI